jgi:hypothetical protein
VDRRSHKKERPVILSATISVEAWNMLEDLRQLRRGNRSYAVEDSIRLAFAKLKRKDKRKIEDERFAKDSLRTV